MGIAARDLPHITEEFYQADNVKREANQSRGFGLGLAIARRAAERHGGSLRARTPPTGPAPV